VWAGFDVLNDYQGGAVKASYVLAGELGPVALEAEGSVKFYHKDGLFSTLELRDGNGLLASFYRYDEFGVLTQQTGTAYNPYAYTGQSFDAENSLYYLRRRYYTPTWGRFMSRDQYLGDVRWPNSLHAYAYVENNPLIYLDPSGTSVVGAIVKLTVRGMKKLGKLLARRKQLMLFGMEMTYCVGAEVWPGMWRRRLVVEDDDPSTIDPMENRSSGHIIIPPAQVGSHCHRTFFYSVTGLLTFSYYAEGHGRFAEGAAFLGDMINPLTLPNDIGEFGNLLGELSGEHGW
jgi:RHS repeat-associated protein